MTDEEIKELKEEGLKVSGIIETLMDLHEIRYVEFYLIEEYKIEVLSRREGWGDKKLVVRIPGYGKSGRLLCIYQGRIDEYHRGKWSQNILDDEEKIEKGKEEKEKFIKKQRGKMIEERFSEVDY